MWKRVKRWLTGRTKAQTSGQEADVRHDSAQPNDANSFVGRVSGDDAGYANETGAERRAEQRAEAPSSDPRA
jgi:hypothetical protein